MADPAPMPPTWDEVLHNRVVVRVPGRKTVAVRRDVAYAVRPPGPGHDAKTSLHMDVYTLAPAVPPPLVVLVHGGPIPRLGAKNLGVSSFLRRAAGCLGVRGDRLQPPLSRADRLADACDDVGTLLDHVRADAAALGIDGDRIALWAFSGGGPLLAEPLRRRAGWLRAVAAYYAVLDATSPEYSPVAALGSDARTAPPLWVARAGRDDPGLNATVDRFVQAAIATGATLDLATHPTGRHGFDFLDDDSRSAAIIRSTIAWLHEQLDVHV